MTEEILLPNALKVSLSITHIRLINNTILKLYERYMKDIGEYKEKIIVLNILSECIRTTKKIDYLDIDGIQNVSLYMLKKVLEHLKIEDTYDTKITEEILYTIYVLGKNSDKSINCCNII
jgi:hypothetical protein